MHVDSEFTVGIHTLLIFGFFTDDRITSDMVAKSIGCNPVIVRKVFGKLSRAGLLNPGKGNARTVLARPADEITLKDVFMATQEEDVDSTFNMYPANPKCPVGSEIHGLLHSRFASAMDAMLDDLDRTTIADLAAELPPEKKHLPEELRKVRSSLLPSIQEQERRVHHDEHGTDVVNEGPGNWTEDRQHRQADGQEVPAHRERDVELDLPDHLAGDPY